MQVLVSVHTVDEAAQVLAAGVSLIDLKDPRHGALAALSLSVSADIVQFIHAQLQGRHGRVTISATVGDAYPGEQALLALVAQRVSLGLDILKFPEVIWSRETQPWLTQCQQAKVSCVAVMTPERLHGADWRADITHCHAMGYQGVMLDTQHKQQSLLAAVNPSLLNAFVQAANQTGMFAGLAGGMQLTDIPEIHATSAAFIGFRGGLSQSGNRALTLDPSRLQKLDQYRTHYLSDACKFTDY